MPAARDLRTHPLHLGLGARAEGQPAFAGMDWYEAYARRTAGDGAEGRLVSLHDSPPTGTCGSAIRPGTR